MHLRISLWMLDPAARARLTSAMSATHDPTMFKNVIGGELVDAASGATYDVLDPTTGAVPYAAPVVGSRTSYVAPETASTSSPPMTFFSTFRSVFAGMAEVNRQPPTGSSDEQRNPQVDRRYCYESNR
jgi:hypothetical protein